MKRLILVLGLLGGSVSAENLSGNQYYDTCNEYPDIGNAQAGWCSGYLIGLVEGTKIGAFNVLTAIEPAETAAEMDEMTNQFLNVCQPDGVNYGQLLDVFVLYMRKNPEARHESARTLLLSAMSEAFPCE